MNPCVSWQAIPCDVMQYYRDEISVCCHFQNSASLERRRFSLLATPCPTFVWSVHSKKPSLSIDKQLEMGTCHGKMGTCHGKICNRQNMANPTVGTSCRCMKWASSDRFSMRIEHQSKELFLVCKGGHTTTSIIQSHYV